MAVLTGLIFGLREIVPVLSTGVVYLLAVLLVSSYWGLWMGLATAVVSALAFNFFHIPPTGRFTIAESENWVALVVFLVAATVTSTWRAPHATAPRRRSAAGTRRTCPPSWPACSSAGSAWRTRSGLRASASRAPSTCRRCRSSWDGRTATSDAGRFR